jgi:hypothetical protein
VVGVAILSFCNQSVLVEDYAVTSQDEKRRDEGSLVGMAGLVRIYKIACTLLGHSHRSSSQSHCIETSMKYTFTLAVAAVLLNTGIASPLNVEARQGVSAAHLHPV